MYGTTSCEAVHGELKHFFQQTVQQTRRHAICMVSLFNFKKLITGMLQRQSLYKCVPPVDLLHSASKLVQKLQLDMSISTCKFKKASRSTTDISLLPVSTKLSAHHKASNCMKHRAPVMGWCRLCSCKQ